MIATGFVKTTREQSEAIAAAQDARSAQIKAAQDAQRRRDRHAVIAVKTGGNIDLTDILTDDDAEDRD